MTMSPGLLVLCVFLGCFGTTGSYNPSPSSSGGFPKHCLTFDCGSLHLIPTVVGWLLSDNGLSTNLVTGDGKLRLHVSAIARSLSCGYPCRFLGDSLVPGVFLTLKCFPLFNTLFQYCPPYSPSRIARVLIPTSLQSINEISSISPSHGDLGVLHWIILVSWVSLGLWIVVYLAFILQLIHTYAWVHAVCAFLSLGYLTQGGFSF